MPYRIFAESFNELHNLMKLVDKLEKAQGPVKELKDENYLTNEFKRIRLDSSKGVLVFGTHASDYIRIHLCYTYSTVIKVMELKRKLPQLSMMDDREMYLYKHCSKISSGLEDIALFYEDLNEILS